MRLVAFISASLEPLHAVLVRCHAHEPAEHGGEVARGPESHHPRDLGDGQLRLGEQGGGPVDARAHHEPMRRQPGAALKQAGEVERATVDEPPRARGGQKPVGGAAVIIRGRPAPPGRREPVAARWPSRSRPLIPGIRRSSTTQPVRPRSADCRKASADSNVSTRKPTEVRRFLTDRRSDSSSSTIETTRLSSWLTLPRLRLPAGAVYPTLVG